MMLPYSEADVVEDGVQCYLCDKFTGTTWLSVANHLRKMHGVSALELADTYIGGMARTESNTQRRGSHAVKKEKDIAPALQNPYIGRWAPVADTVHTKPDGTSWRPF
jgi:hypothetical protein